MQVALDKPVPADLQQGNRDLSPYSRKELNSANNSDELELGFILALPERKEALVTPCFGPAGQAVPGLRSELWGIEFVLFQATGLCSFITATLDSESEGSSLLKVSSGENWLCVNW